MLRWTADDGATVVGRLYPTATAPDAAAAALLDPRRPDRPAPGHLRRRGRRGSSTGAGPLLVPDHRGSTGHGRAYAQAMAGRWGELDVADCAAGVRHVLAAGVADPDRVVAMGSSAGGFTTLLLLAHHPDLFAAGVALSAVADIVDLSERSHRFERHYNDTLVGPLPAAWSLQRGRSPLAAAERITAPLLLLHGDADDVVPVEQARALAERLSPARPRGRAPRLRGRGPRLGPARGRRRRAHPDRAVPGPPRAADPGTVIRPGSWRSRRARVICA